MNSNHYSKVVLAALLLVVSAGVVGGVSVSGDAPEQAQVDSEISKTYTITEPFQPYQNWTLEGSTELRNVTWRIREIDTANQTVNSVTYPEGGDSTPRTFEHQVSQRENIARLTVTVSGDVPSVSNYTYSPPNTISVATFEQRKGNSVETIATFQTHPYTEDSMAAREAIDSARETLNGSSAPSGAREDLQDAIDFYDGEQFDSAITNAERAEEKANQAQQQSQLVTLVLMGGGALLVLALLVGGFYWYRSNQTGSKL